MGQRLPLHSRGDSPGHGLCVPCPELGIDNRRRETGGYPLTHQHAGPLPAGHPGGSPGACSAPRPATGPFYLAPQLSLAEAARPHLFQFLPQHHSPAPRGSRGDSSQTQTRIKRLRWPHLFTLTYLWPKFTVYETGLS